MNHLPLDLGAISQQVLSLEFQSGTMITGEEELLKKFFTLRSEGDITVIHTVDIIYLEQLKGINRVRIGEEQEIVHLIDYLTNSTVRE